VLSARRVPDALSELVATTRLRSELDAALADPVLGPARDATCLVVSEAGSVIYARQAELPLVPASTMKVLTGMAALTRLGADTRYVTEARAAARPVDGVVNGSLWMIGTGDPLLLTSDYAATFRNQPQVHTPLEQLADDIVAAGVRHVRGSVVGDESRYDRIRYVATWPRNYIVDNDIGPASALTVNDGFVSYPPARRVATDDPSQHAAAVLTRLLRARGVTVDGAPASDTFDGSGVVVGKVASPPIGDIVGAMIRESDNLTAELLVKELGVRFGGAGTWDAGLDVVRDTLADRGLRAEAMAAVDGSGLSRSDRLTCSLLMQAMEIVGPDGPVALAFPVAAESGTLADRFHGNPAAGLLRAKTGSLRGVAGLAGYADAGADKLLAFALLANELPRDAYGRALQERVGAALVSYPDAPTPDVLAPKPPNLRQ
jgi:D-alanyl-D-alanine carboxypeptidase/D-alanyl-D-alanine-endopeptidase (penicillin-binding protein 4)